MQTLRGRGFRLGIVTDGTALLQSKKIEVARLAPLVDAVLVSESEGYKKPAPQIFERAAQRLGVTPAPCCLVGDHPQNDIVAAAGVGMKTAWLRGVQGWPDGLNPNPDFTFDSLDQLPELVGAAE